jgi:enterochelin esterase-like enzyme
MKWPFLLIASVALFTRALPAQDHSLFSQTFKTLCQTDSTAAVFEKLNTSRNIPFVVGDSVLFLYRGEANSVKWMGDFNSWGYNKTFLNSGTRIQGANVWYLKAAFPSDARLDYKIVLNNEQWILDPHNPLHQWSGVGGGSPNSELRMPAWKTDASTSFKPSAPAGKLIKDILFTSQSLGYQVTYSIYLPDAYDPLKTYPVLYVTDGYEYLHENMGNLYITLNNLIHQKTIRPVIAVLVDHREPVNRSNNKRMTELALNEKYLRFFTHELIPSVESNYRISKLPGERAIIGTSMGGLSAAYFSFSRPDLFGLAGIQSPAFWFKPEIYTLCGNPEKPPVKVFMSTGTIHDTEEGARKMKSILEKSTCTYQYKEVNQGHSWGNWRDLVDDILIYFFPLN